MSNKDILLSDEEVLRSYRDAEFREGLTPEQIMFAANHELRPDDYVGDFGELSDEDLEAVAGGAEGSSNAWYCISSGSCCSGCAAK